MSKFIMTFGSNQLKDFNVVPTNIMLVIEAENETEARKPLFGEPFNGAFCTSYAYSCAKRMKEKYGMKEIGLKALLALKLP